MNCSITPIDNGFVLVSEVSIDDDLNVTMTTWFEFELMMGRVLLNGKGYGSKISELMSLVR